MHVSVRAAYIYVIEAVGFIGYFMPFLMFLQKLANDSDP